MSSDEIEQIIGRAFPYARVLSMRKLEGGVSAIVSAVELETDAGGRTVVLRQYGEADLAHDPLVAAHESVLLRKLRVNGLSVPESLYFDEANGRYIIVSFIDGTSADNSPNTTECARQMAEILAEIHKVRSKDGVEYLRQPADVFSRKLRDVPEVMDESLSESKVRSALQNIDMPVQLNDSTILHGDFWPGNIMMKDGQVSGVIDWEDAMFGDPLVDLANGRLEILMLFGEEEMYEFTERYKALMPLLNYDNLAYWELFAALRPAGKMGSWGLDDETLSRLQNGHRKFVDQAIGNLNRL